MAVHRHRFQREMDEDNQALKGVDDHRAQGQPGSDYFCTLNDIKGIFSHTISHCITTQSFQGEVNLQHFNLSSFHRISLPNPIPSVAFTDSASDALLINRRGQTCFLHRP